MNSYRMSFKDAVRYRGGTSMWAWALHRLTGLGVVLFLAVHIFETFIIVLGPEAYNRALATYNTVGFRIAEIGLLFAVLYHAVNGLRITIQDLWPALWRYERTLIWVSAVLILGVFAPLAVWGLLPVLRGEL